MKNTNIHPEDEELDPKRLKFGMSEKERKELEAQLKKKNKKLTKKWTPTHH